jgi:hypothetical protein
LLSEAPEYFAAKAALAELAPQLAALLELYDQQQQELQEQDAEALAAESAMQSLGQISLFSSGGGSSMGPMHGMGAAPGSPLADPACSGSWERAAAAAVADYPEPASSNSRRVSFEAEAGSAVHAAARPPDEALDFSSFRGAFSAAGLREMVNRPSESGSGHPTTTRATSQQGDVGDGHPLFCQGHTTAG